MEESDLQDNERSNFSSRRNSFSQDDRPLKKLKAGRPKQSFVWAYFITIENDGNYCQVPMPSSSKYPDGICNHKVDNGPTTTNMINHLRKAHNIINPAEQEVVNNLLIFFKSN